MWITLFAQACSLHSVYNIKDWKEIKQKMLLEWFNVLWYINDAEKSSF